MASQVIGQAHCPECGRPENVMSDGRKLYIKCTADDCRVFTHDQARSAKARLQNRLTAQAPVPDDNAAAAAENAHSKPTVTPPQADYKPAKAPDFFESLDDLF